MVFIHGGGYTFGSIKDYVPGPLMDKDVVLVQMQYRLGVMGKYNIYGNSRFVLKILKAK